MNCSDYQAEAPDVQEEVVLVGISGAKVGLMLALLEAAVRGRLRRTDGLSGLSRHSRRCRDISKHCQLSMVVRAIGLAVCSQHP